MASVIMPAPAKTGTTVSLRRLLFPSDAAGKACINERLDVLVDVPRGLSRDQVIEAALAVLDVPLGDVIFKAWEQFSEVRKAMAETRGQPPVPHQVRVMGHTLSSTHHPVVQCELEGKQVFELVLDLELSVHFEGAVVTVAAGEIVKVAPGNAVATTSLKKGEVLLVPEQKTTLTFPEAIIRRTSPVEVAGVH